MAINLPLLNKSTSQTLGAQVYMLSNIPVNFHNSNSNTFGAIHDTSWKWQFFIMSRAVTLSLPNESASKPLKTQCTTFLLTFMTLHILLKLCNKKDFGCNFWMT